MRTLIRPILTALFLVPGLANLAEAQPYSINWHKIAGGGGAGAGGNFSLAGTIGQHDASMTATNNQFTITGGYWSMINVVQSAGLPNLIIVANGNGGVEVRWPDTGSYTLQQNSDLANGTWSTTGFPITTANGTNSISLSAPAGNLFFRLKQ
jgi:hypothetical protein